ncbi:FIVAR domain-containing protein, partial [Staphylococcus aureus]|uniref:FIVAR domain-containing protein n=1 Tax=Staphylococcus aureus TaxID=1280 RepID=UPI00065B73D2
AMPYLKNGIHDLNTITTGVNFTDADETNRTTYTNALTPAEQNFNKEHGPHTSKDGVENALENEQRAKKDLNGKQNDTNTKP